MRSVAASRAYQASAGHRSIREQEAEIFFKVNSGLRLALSAGTFEQTRAVADNDRLWTTVIDLMRDPTNALPDTIRAAVISVGLSVKREAARPEPDLNFMLQVNEHVAKGLAGV